VKRRLADSFFFIALLSERDACHHRATEVSRESGALIITTRWVLAEVADALCAPAWRGRAGALIEFVLTAPGFLVLGRSDELFARGLDLYRGRSDKERSLTDCISFVVMADEGVAEALTGDRHFEQAGSKALLL
jgi:predicted nucleic acid-binding protein